MLVVRMTPEQRQNLFVFLARVDLKGREVNQFNDLTELFIHAEPVGAEEAPHGLKMSGTPPTPAEEQKPKEEKPDA